MTTTYDHLMEYVRTRPIANTHCHHLRDQDFASYDLDVLLKNSYVAWCGVPWSETRESRVNLLEQVRFNSLFVWLHKSLQEVYRLDGPLTADNWERLSSMVREAHRDRQRHIEMLKDLCGYARVIQDAYWDPGSDNGHPDLFTPTFRVNSFLFGYSRTVVDHDGNNALALYDRRIQDIDEYVGFVREMIRLKIDQGCVALKVPVAYDRRLDFEPTTKEAAQRAFVPEGAQAGEADVKAFQDYVFYEMCKIAAEFDVPVQCHTGMGKLRRTQAMWMREVIEQNPQTRFVLLHCSYPWVDDTTALLRYYPNVYPDLSMLPLYSTSSCQRILHELIEGGTADKVCWGCDTWTPEESYGSLLAFRHVLVKVLAEKVDDGYFSVDDARAVADNITYQNPLKLYRLSA